MAKQKLSKSDLLKKMGDHMLSHGVNTASLRPLAKAAETSDRMLIYHFGSKDALVAEVLQHLAVEYAGLLDQSLPAEPATACGPLLRDIIGRLRAPELRGYIHIWLDLVSASAQGNSDHVDTGHKVAAFFIEWIKQRLPRDIPDPDATAMLMLTLIEGTHALDSVGQSAIADQAIAAAFPD